LSFLIGLLLVAAVVLAIARPLLRPRAGPGEPRPPDGADREETLRLLAELEYDFRMDKIDAAEYRQQREILERRLGR
jgi:hypothetical protein